MRRKINNQYLAKLNRRLSLMQFEAPGWVKILALLRGHILEKSALLVRLES